MFSLMLIREFLEDIKKQKMRAFLTTIAITWGTLTLILLMSFGAGLSFRMQESFLNAYDKVTFVWNGQTTKKFEGLPIGRNINLMEDDCDLLQRSIPMIGGISASMGKWVRLRIGDKSTSSYMEGVYPDFEFLRRMYPSAGGRFLDHKDLIEQRRTVYLGPVTAERLFDKEDPIGKKVVIDGVPFTVVGVMQKKMQSAMNNGPDNERAIIPFSTYQSIYGDRYIGHMLIKAVHAQDTKLVIQEIRRVLGRKYRFDPTDESAVGIWDVTEAEDMSRKVFLGINIFLAVVGSMTLVIAGIGVANIMYVVVKERTREIGIKRAVGAKKHHIVSQFIFESLFIALIGGGLGLAIASGIIKLVWMMPVKEGPAQYLLRPLMSGYVVVVSIGFLTLIGLLAGLFPARKASNIDPIEALRYE